MSALHCKCWILPRGGGSGDYAPHSFCSGGIRWNTKLLAPTPPGRSQKWCHMMPSHDVVMSLPWVPGSVVCHCFCCLMSWMGSPWNYLIENIREYFPVPWTFRPLKQPTIVADKRIIDFFFHVFLFPTRFKKIIHPRPKTEQNKCSEHAESGDMILLNIDNLVRAVSQLVPPSDILPGRELMLG